MTKQEAQAESVRRWGPDAVAVFLGPVPYPYAVGIEDRCGGRGDSWEAAFADADRRAEVTP